MQDFVNGGAFPPFSENPITELAVLLMIDFKCRPVRSSYFFRFRRTEKMDSVMKGLMGAMLPPEFLG